MVCFYQLLFCPNAVVSRSFILALSLRMWWCIIRYWSWLTWVAQVTDVADALILNRLFDHLFRYGVVSINKTSAVDIWKFVFFVWKRWSFWHYHRLAPLKVWCCSVYVCRVSWHLELMLQVLVSTSNRAPAKLYEGGLQRDLFLPFIAKLKVCKHPFMSPRNIVWFYSAQWTLSDQMVPKKCSGAMCDTWDRFGHRLSKIDSGKTMKASYGFSHDTKHTQMSSWCLLIQSINIFFELWNCDPNRLFSECCTERR